MPTLGNYIIRQNMSNKYGVQVVDYSQIVLFTTMQQFYLNYCIIIEKMKVF
jgi:hypothetical protein